MPDVTQNRVKHCFANAIVGFEDVLIWSVKRTGLDHSTVHRIFRMEGVVLYPCARKEAGGLDVETVKVGRSHPSKREGAMRRIASRTDEVWLSF